MYCQASTPPKTFIDQFLIQTFQLMFGEGHRGTLKAESRSRLVRVTISNGHKTFVARKQLLWLEDSFFQKLWISKYLWWATIALGGNFVWSIFLCNETTLLSVEELNFGNLAWGYGYIKTLCFKEAFQFWLIFLNTFSRNSPHVSLTCQMGMLTSGWTEQELALPFTGSFKQQRFWHLVWANLDVL